MPEVNLSAWRDFLRGCPAAHLLQTPAWGELKTSYGWNPSWVISGSLGAQILFQELPFGYQIAYLPRGPVSAQGPLESHPDWTDFLEAVDVCCQKRKTIFLKVEPDGWQDEYPRFPGFQDSGHSIQPPRTIVISLEESEEDILARMKSKTRYNIRLAGRKGVKIRQIESVDPFYDLLEGTAERAEFGIHTREYYRLAFELFRSTDQCALFLAEFEDTPLASIMVFQRAERSWYFYGASSSRHRELMATYLIQWEAMRWAKSLNCVSYDLWGVPDFEQDLLEEQFTQRGDGLWGVYRFKRGFGGELKRSPGPWDRVYRPGLYRLYQLRNQLTGSTGQ